MDNPFPEEGLVMKYFVMNPHKRDAYGEASRRGILKYAKVIKKENRKLAREMVEWIKEIEISEDN